MADIFLSYAHEDVARAAEVAHALAQCGWSVFWDRRIVPGASWDQVLERELAAARCVVVLWSQASVRSHWVRTEATVAHRRGTLVPASLDDAEIPLAFQLLEAAQLQHWRSGPDDSAFLALREGVSHLLGVAPQESVPPPLPRLVPGRLPRWMRRIAIAAPTATAALWLIGFMTTAQFNLVFGRTGRFARFGAEPWLSYIAWGFLATFPVVVIMVLAAASVMAARFVCGLLALTGPGERLAGGLRAAAGSLARGAGLNRSSNLAQALVCLGVATLVGLFWYHADLIRAWSSFFNSAPIEMLLPMTDSAPERNQYHIELSIATFALAFGLYQVVTLRNRESTREGRAAIVMLAVVIAIAVLMNEAPYRTFHHRDFERIDLAGVRCYITGESGDEALVLCPGEEPPRVRTVRRDDPALRRLGIIENVFKGVNPASAAR